MSLSIPAIEILDVRKNYADLTALAGVSFTVAQGELFGLLGPNGAGKSTLINIMAGLTCASSGQVRIMGHDVRSAYRQARRALGLVPQELVFDPFFPVRKFLRLQAGYFGLGDEAYAWIDELLQLLDLQDKANITLRKLSGGMKRRVLIAQALVHRPPVVVLDEPTAGVDVELRQALWRLVRRLHKEGHTVVLTTHYLEEAESLCDRIAILNHGRLCALESKSALIARHPYRLVSLSLRDARAILPQVLQDCVEQRRDAHVSLRLDKKQYPLGRVLQTLASVGIEVEDIETQAPGLEEVFLDIVGRK